MFFIFLFDDIKHYNYLISLILSLFNYSLSSFYYFTIGNIFFLNLSLFYATYISFIYFI